MRKYIESEQIRSLDELNGQSIVYVNGKVTHCGWFQSWPIRLANRYLNAGAIRYVVPRLTQEIQEDDFLMMLGG